MLPAVPALPSAKTLTHPPRSDVARRSAAADARA